MSKNIIVVGAGPIGLFSAYQAAKLGVEVVVFEEHSTVGVPSHCTGHISLSGIRRLSLQLPTDVFENHIKSAIFYSPCGYQFAVRFASPVTCVVNRQAFDQHLAHMALKAGVNILYNTRASSFLLEKTAVKGVVIEEKKQTKELVSRVVIDAEGVSSTLLRQVGLPTLNPRMIVNGVQAEVDRVHGVESDTVEVFLSNHFAPGFFAWIVPRSDGTAKVGLGTARGNAHDCFRHLRQRNHIVRKRLKGSHITSLGYHPISLGGPTSRTFFDGLIVVGDTASQVKPTTGGGIIMGLTCAEIAGKVAAQAVHSSDSSARFLHEYERQWKEKVGFDMMAMRRLRLMLNNLSDKQLDHLIVLCARLRLDETLREMKDIDFQGGSLLRSAGNPRVFATALYLLTAPLL